MHSVNIRHQYKMRQDASLPRVSFVALWLEIQYGKRKPQTVKSTKMTNSPKRMRERRVQMCVCNSTASPFCIIKWMDTCKFPKKSVWSISIKRNQISFVQFENDIDTTWTIRMANTVHILELIEMQNGYVHVHPNSFRTVQRDYKTKRMRRSWQTSHKAIHPID